ncbi:MAG: hypothetical protein ACI90V_005686, partial [Bacillariaceae sp.]
EEGQTFIDYSPQNWDDIKCNEGSKLDECVGYIDKWTTGRDWGITKNDCRWCPASKDGSGSNNNCGVHHQSPVNLQREVGYDFNTSSPYYSEIANECIVSLCLLHVPCVPCHLYNNNNNNNIPTG